MMTVRLRAARYGGQPSRVEWLANRTSLAVQANEGWRGRRDSCPLAESIGLGGVPEDGEPGNRPSTARDVRS
jgi:hypothetical protein